MTPHVRFIGALNIDPLNKMETWLAGLRILADCHPLVCVEIPSRESSGSPQMAQAKAIYTKLGVTPSQDPVALRFHVEVLRALPGLRAIWRCEPTLMQDRESGPWGCHSPKEWPAHCTARAVTHPDVGSPFQPGTAITVCVRPAVPPPMPRLDARNLPSRTAPALIADSASGGRVGGVLAKRVYVCDKHVQHTAKHCSTL